MDLSPQLELTGFRMPGNVDVSTVTTINGVRVVLLWRMNCVHNCVCFVFDRIAVIDQPVIDEELRNTSRDVHRLIRNLSDRLKLVDCEQNCECDEEATSDHFLLSLRGLEAERVEIGVTHLESQLVTLGQLVLSSRVD